MAALSFAGIGELISSYQTSTSERALTVADSCLHEALLGLKQNEMYSGGSLSLGSDSCTISVNGFGDARTITVTATSRQTTREIQATVNLSASGLVEESWLEKIN